MSRASRRRARTSRSQADSDRMMSYLFGVIVKQDAEIKRLQGPAVPAAPVLRLVPRDG